MVLSGRLYLEKVRDEKISSTCDAFAGFDIPIGR